MVAELTLHSAYYSTSLCIKVVTCALESAGPDPFVVDIHDRVEDLLLLLAIVDHLGRGTEALLQRIEVAPARREEERVRVSMRFTLDLLPLRAHQQMCSLIVVSVPPA